MADMIASGDTAGAAAPSGAGSAPPASPSGGMPVTGSPSPGTTAPADAGSPPAPQDVGPIPLERHKEILENARRKEAEKYAWLGSRTRADVEKMEQWYRYADADPVGFHARFGDLLKQHPVYGRHFQAPPAQAEPPAPEPVLEPDYQDQNGQPAYSARAVEAYAKKLREHLASDFDRKLDSRLGPVEQGMRSSLLSQRTKAIVAEKLAEARTWEGFSDLEASIKARMANDKRLSLEGAYQRAFQEEFLPKLRERSRQEVLAELNQKAHATTERAAGQPPSSQKSAKDMSWEEVLRAFVK